MVFHLIRLKKDPSKQTAELVSGAEQTQTAVEARGESAAQLVSGAAKFQLQELQAATAPASGLVPKGAEQLLEYKNVPNFSREQLRYMFDSGEDMSQDKNRFMRVKNKTVPFRPDKAIKIAKPSLATGKLPTGPDASSIHVTLKEGALVQVLTTAPAAIKNMTVSSTAYPMYYCMIVDAAGKEEFGWVSKAALKFDNIYYQPGVEGHVDNVELAPHRLYENSYDEITRTLVNMYRALKIGAKVSGVQAHHTNLAEDLLLQIQAIGKAKYDKAKAVYVSYFNKRRSVAISAINKLNPEQLTKAMKAKRAKDKNHLLRMDVVHVAAQAVAKANRVAPGFSTFHSTIYKNSKSVLNKADLQLDVGGSKVNVSMYNAGLALERAMSAGRQTQAAIDEAHKQYKSDAAKIKTTPAGGAVADPKLKPAIMIDFNADSTKRDKTKRYKAQALVAQTLTEKNRQKQYTKDAAANLDYASALNIQVPTSGVSVAAKQAFNMVKSNVGLRFRSRLKDNNAAILPIHTQFENVLDRSGKTIVKSYNVPNSIVAGSTIKITGNGVRMRDISGKRLGSVSKSSSVTLVSPVLKKITVGSKQYEMYKIKSGSKTGYVAKAYVENQASTAYNFRKVKNLATGKRGWVAEKIRGVSTLAKAVLNRNGFRAASKFRLAKGVVAPKGAPLTYFSGPDAKGVVTVKYKTKTYKVDQRKLKYVETKMAAMTQY